MSWDFLEGWSSPFAKGAPVKEFPVWLPGRMRPASGTWHARLQYRLDERPEQGKENDQEQAAENHRENGLDRLELGRLAAMPAD